MGQGAILDHLHRALDGSALRNTVLSNNIANVETPGYQRQDVHFHHYLQRALQLGTTHPRHLPVHPETGVGYQLTTDRSRGRNDGNNVDIDREMALLARNSTHYQALSRQTAQYLRNLKQAIAER